MLVIGMDAHRRMLYAVAVDEQGHEVSHWQGHNTAMQWAEVLAWADEVGDERDRCWGIEGSGHQGRGVAQLLVGQGEVVFEINPRWTAAARQRSRRRDKTDHEDARAITRLLRQEAESLPRVHPDDLTTPLAVLTRERDTLQTDITRNRNRLHAELLRVEPAYKQHLPALTKRQRLEAVLTWDARVVGISAWVQLEGAQRRARRLLALMDDLDRVSEQLSRPVCQPLTALFGVGELTAGMLAGYLGPGRRFTTDAQLPRYARVAPLEASSARRTRHRLNRGGHRKLNEIIHRIALTQARGYHPAQTYLARRQAEGKTWREALRALKHYHLEGVAGVSDSRAACQLSQLADPVCRRWCGRPGRASPAHACLSRGVDMWTGQTAATPVVHLHGLSTCPRPLRSLRSAVTHLPHQSPSNR